MSEAGFINPAAVRSAMRRLLLRERLEHMAESVSALLNRLEHAGQVDRDRVSALVERSVELGDGDIESGVSRKPINFIEGKNVREQELLHGADLILKLLDATFDGIGQGLFLSSVETGAQRNPAEGAAHRLSETQK